MLFFRFSFAKVTGDSLFNQITLLSFNINYVLALNGLILIGTLLSSYIPLLLIRKIKPNEILRKVDE